MKVPFNDLPSLHRESKDYFHRCLDDVLERSDFIGGAAITDFEVSFAQACGVSQAVGVASGTDALYVALKVLGIREGDHVVTAPNSFIATAEAISLCGARPLFVEVGEDDFNMDPVALESVLKEHPNRDSIKAIIPVHLHGRPAKMSRIRALADEHKKALVADGAQAHLATCEGRPVAQWADLTTYSFYPGKNLGALGDAGAVVGDDEGLCEKVRQFSNHGRHQKYLHEVVGCNARMDTLQAMFLQEKLKSLSRHTMARQKLALEFRKRLCGVGDISFSADSPDQQSVYHLMVILSEKRDALQDHLKTKGIQTGVHYPVPLHLQPAYAHLGYKKGDFAVTERLAEQQLSLPLFPTMDEEQLDWVCNGVQSFFG